jgi:phosphonoacetaldehyde hydrolase
MSIKLCILDWAGTAVDFGCFAPIHAFIKAFGIYGIVPTIEETRKPMGMLKIDHIKAMLEMERINQLWISLHKNKPTNEDINNIYTAFEDALFIDLDKYATPIENVETVVSQLKTDGIKIGSTTGYTQKMMEIVRESARHQGYTTEYLTTPDSTGVGRPDPSMIFDNMEHFSITDRNEVIKVGDTISDILEGYNAGVWCVGVIKGSSELGLSAEDYRQLKDIRINEIVRQNYIAAGADFVIEEINLLPALIKKINFLVESGEKPNGYKL